jgi:hypothetical protein
LGFGRDGVNSGGFVGWFRAVEGEIVDIFIRQLLRNSLSDVLNLFCGELISTG